MPATAQLSPNYSNSKIQIVESEAGDGGYWTTTSELFDIENQKIPKPIAESRKPVRKRMMARRVLEESAEFLSPLRLPRTLRLIASDCTGNDGDGAYYRELNSHSPMRVINICYSLMVVAENLADSIVKLEKEGKLRIPLSREQFIAGMYAGVLIHETGHALVDQLDIPMFGREEDAADAIAAFVALQFSQDTAKTVIKGFAYLWELLPDPPTAKLPFTDPEQQCRLDPFCAYADEHGTPSQRLYNTLCIAYGGDPATFQEFVDSGWLPAERAKNCKNEYEQAKFAFEKTVLPFIDQDQLQKVRARQWFRSEELGEDTQP